MLKATGKKIFTIFYAENLSLSKPVSRCDFSTCGIEEHHRLRQSSLLAYINITIMFCLLYMIYYYSTLKESFMNISYYKQFNIQSKYKYITEINYI